MNFGSFSSGGDEIIVSMHSVYVRTGRESERERISVNYEFGELERYCKVKLCLCVRERKRDLCISTFPSDC